MRNDTAYGTSRAEALRAYQAGVPAALPADNPWKWIVADHRYGAHVRRPFRRCPACSPEVQQ